MARTITEIQQDIFDSISQNENLQALNSTSNVAIYRLIVYVISSAIWVLEKLFDFHKAELQKELFEQKSGTLPWYRTMALAFQFGFDLLTDSDKFDNNGATAEQIELSKIVKYAAVSEGTVDSRVILKIAGESSQGVLTPITLLQFEAFEAYIKEIKYAGVKTTIINYLPDRLFLNLQIIRNPLLIDGSGNSILNGGKPVEQAIKVFMKNLPFDGEFVVEHLEKYLMDNVEGVEVAHVINTQSSWIDPTINDYGTPQPINVRAIPVSGYYEVQNFNDITYVV